MLPARAPLSDWLTWLETLSPTEIELGLDRVGIVLDRLALPCPEHLLLIAGTNGKGSCVAMSSAVLSAAGMRVGSYTSPHIRYFNERIALDGDVSSDDAIKAAFRIVEEARRDVRLTYFEFATLAAAVVFAAADLDVWIMEVGLGGRLDATNAFEPTASLITNVSLDHCDWLGDNVESIGSEKAGVMRAGKPTVFGNPAIPKSVLAHAERISATCLLAGRDFKVSINDDATWNWQGVSQTCTGLHRPGLPGSFQVENAAATLTLLEAAGFSGEYDQALVDRVLPGVSLEGRMQRETIGGIEWLFDVAHNTSAAKGLADNLRDSANNGKTTALIGLLGDKDINGIVAALASVVDRWIAVMPDSPRGVAAVELSRQIANQIDAPCLIAASAADAVNSARRGAAENDRIVVTGSFFTVAPVLAELESIARRKT